MESKDVAKTKLLSHAALEDLRIRVQKRYLSNALDRKPMIINTFLGSYEALRGDILRVFPNAEPSISLTRLRKFFYYTNPALCATEQLERGSFGKDFLEALERYAGESTVSIPVGNQKRWWMLGTLFIVGAIIISIFLSCPETPKAWREEFHDVSIKGLQKRGWEFMDFDSTWFNKQLWRDSMLTLWTLPGDYWVKEREKRQITNMVVRKIEGDCFTITIKIDSFSQNQVSQQVDIFLLDENLSRETNLRFGFGFEKPTLMSLGRYNVMVVSQEKGEVQPPKGQILKVVKSKQDLHFNQTIWLKLSVQSNKVLSSVKSSFSWYPWNGSEEPTTIRFKPAFIGIGAFQGWTLDDGTPKGADTIPVFIDYLIFEPCTNTK